ncbi:MAG: aldo/keto reductase [Candidatus Nanohaloarchaea archaeon]
MELGLGTWQNTGDQCRKSVEHALNIGYRHIDTAQAYDNEEHVGVGIKASNVDREDIFLASKVWTSNLMPSNVVSSTEESLQKLGTEYVDLMYIHWPSGDYQGKETLEALQSLKQKGLVKNIGVSNFEVPQIEEALDHVDVYANQIEMHPLLPQHEIREFCEENGVEAVAYSPLARGEVFNIKEIQEVAEKHGVSEAQVSLAWIMEKGATPIPKASTEEHIEDNLKIRKLELDEEDIEKINSIRGEERMIDPEFAPWS